MDTDINIVNRLKQISAIISNLRQWSTVEKRKSKYA